MTTDTRNEPIHRKFWFHLLLVLLISALLYFLFFASLGWITNHGEQTKVPDITGKPISVAMAQLKAAGFEVDVDSTYEPDKKPLVVLQQLPDVGDIVKTGRTLFLIVNKAEPPMTPMPNLGSLSYRSALLILKSNKLVLADTIHKPYAIKFVLEQLVNGKEVRPGTLIPQGSKVTLVFGDGLVNQDMPVPDVIGLPLRDGLDMLSGNGLFVVAINGDNDGQPVDSGAVIIYKTSPPPFNGTTEPNRIFENNSIDVYYKREPSPEELEAGKNQTLPDAQGNPDAPTAADPYTTD